MHSCRSFLTIERATEEEQTCTQQNLPHSYVIILHCTFETSRTCMAWRANVNRSKGSQMFVCIRFLKISICMLIAGEIWYSGTRLWVSIHVMLNNIEDPESSWARLSNSLSSNHGHGDHGASTFCVPFSSLGERCHLVILFDISDIWVWVKIRYPNNWMVNTKLD